MDFDPANPGNLIYSRPAEHGKIFVSSKMNGGALTVERRAAVEAIEEFPLTRPWAWEYHAEAGPYCSERECVAQAGTSDGLVLIVEDEITPITRSELKAAQAGGAPIFMMLKTGVARDAELERFIKRVREQANTTVNFSSPAELKTRVASALRTLALRSWRWRMRSWRERTGAGTGGAFAAEDFGNVEVAAGENGSMVPIADLVAEAEQRVENGEAADVLEELWWVVQGAQDVGFGWLSLKLLAEIERIVPGETIDDRWRGWLCNARGLALSQGGSSAGARVEYERMRQLGKALKDVDLESTALQNLGVQDVLDGEHSAARAKFVASLKLKHEMGDLHGGLQVLFNLVNVFIGQDRLDLADRLLDDLRVLMNHVRDPFLRSSLYGNRGIVAIKRGDLKTGQAEFRQALRCARRSGSIPRTITVIQNLGSVAHDLGELARARRWYTQALELAESIDDLNQRRIQRQALALAYVHLGNYAEAAEIFLRVVDEAKELDDQVQAAIALGDAGASLMEAGDPQRGLELTERALAMPGGSDQWRAQQLTNLATSLTALGKPRLALQRALEAANLTVDPAERAETLARAGKLAIGSPETATQAPGIFKEELELRRQHEPSERWAWRAAEIGATLNYTTQTTSAREFFTISLRVFARRADRREAFFIRNDRALASADLGDLPAALADLRMCLQLAEKMNDGALTQQAHMNLGEIRRRTGDNTVAAKHLNRSLAIARRLQDARAECETLTLLALNAQNQHDTEGARVSLHAAEDLAKNLKDSKLQAKACEGQARLEFDAGRYGRASTLYGRASRLLGDERSRHLAECLGGLLISSAHRGCLDEGALEQLIDLSGQLAWDEKLLVDLTSALPALSDRGEDNQVARLTAVTLAVALRLVLPSNEDDPSQFDPFVQAGCAAAWWIEADSKRGKMLVGALQELCGEEAATEVMRMLKGAVEAIAEMRTAAGGEAPPEVLPRAA